MVKGLGNLMKQAQKLQERLAQIQEELETIEVEGTSGGGMVTVVANGKQEIVQVKVDPEVVNPDDVEMLEDLIVAAVNQARERAQEVAEEKMREATGGMLPGLGDGLKIPGLIP
jgi:DNA-binding YbaB/EbfC family protein